MNIFFESISFDLIDSVISYLDNSVDIINLIEILSNYNFFIRIKYVFKLKYGDKMYQNINKLKELDPITKKYSYIEIYFDLLDTNSDELYSPFEEEYNGETTNQKLLNLNNKLFILKKFPHYIKNVIKLETRISNNLGIPYILANYLLELSNTYHNNKNDKNDSVVKILEPLYNQDILNISKIDDNYIKSLYVDNHILDSIKGPIGGEVNWAIPVYIYLIIDGNYKNYDIILMYRLKYFFQGQYFYSRKVIKTLSNDNLNISMIWQFYYNFDIDMRNDDSWIIEE